MKRKLAGSSRLAAFPTKIAAGGQRFYRARNDGAGAVAAHSDRSASFTKGADPMGERKRRIAAGTGEIEKALANSERLFARAREGDCSGVISAVMCWEEANATIKKIGVEAIPDGIANRFIALRDVCEKYSEAMKKVITGGDDVEEARLAEEEGE
jgi:hypothetical protein